MNQTAFNRRQLLGLGTASLGALALSRTARAQTTPAPSTDPMTAAPPAEMPAGSMTISTSDSALLSSALGVEQVGAAFYSQVLGAHQKRAFLNERTLAAATQMAQTKAAHVATIQGALTGTDAGTGTFKFPYTAFVSPVGMAWLGYSLEEISIGAHLDALERLDSRPLRQTVATIIGADSMHAALLRTLSGFQFSPRYFEAKLSPAQVDSLLAAYRA